MEKIDSINTLHAHVMHGADAADEARADIAAARAALGEATAVLRAVQLRADRDIDEWADRVVRIGELLAEHRADYGRGWRRDYDQHGLHMGLCTAYRYIACATYPAGRWLASVEEWARLAVRESERLPSSTRTRGREMTLAEVEREADEIAQAEYVASQRRQTPEQRSASRDAEARAMPPDDHWAALGRQIRDNRHWIAIMAAMADGWLPPECIADTHSGSVRIECIGRDAIVGDCSKDEVGQ